MSETGVGIDPVTFRDLLRNVPVPVAVLTTSLDGRRDGLTVSSFTSLSLSPPLVSVSLSREKPATILTIEAGHFAINILGADAGAVADRFALHHSVPRFEGVAVEDGPAGLPTLTGAVAVLYAGVSSVQEAGDHYLITGEVFAGRNRGGIPLMRYLSRYTEPVLPPEQRTTSTTTHHPSSNIHSKDEAMTVFDKSAPTGDEILALRQVAVGAAPGDVAIRGGQVVRVHTAEIITGDVVVKGRHIAAITPPGRLDATSEVDAEGAFVAPTFIDAHTHLEGARLTVGQHARLSVPRGTTAFFNHANSLSDVLGAKGVDWLHETRAPLRIFEQTVPFITARGINELGGLEMTLDENLDRIRRWNTVSLGESNPYVLEPERARELSQALQSGKRITGHTARMVDEPLWGYLAGGVGDDHNAANLAEVLDRLRLGAIVTLQSGSLTNYIKDILGDPESLGLVGSHICFCADGKYVADINEEGHIDHHARSAVALGIPPALAVRMGTLNAAMHYRVDHLIGSLTPTRLADIQILPDLLDFRPHSVWVGGVEVARDGNPLFEDTDPRPEWTRDTINLGSSFNASNLAVPAPPGASRARVKAMELYDGYYKRALEVELPVKDGYVITDPESGFAKIAVIDRHHGSGKAGVSYLRGFGLTKGALGISTNTGNNNLVIIGATDQDIVHAARVLEELGGGWVVVADGKLLASLPFPVAGVVSDQPWEKVVEQSISVDLAAAELGCDVRLPFQILGYVPLNGVPDYGLTELGLIDVATNHLTDLVISGI